MVINRIENKTLYSNLVYPNWTDRDQFKIVGKLDKEFVSSVINEPKITYKPPKFYADRLGKIYAITVNNLDVIVRFDSKFRDHEDERIRGYRVFADGLDVGWTNDLPGEWVFYPDEPWLKVEELVAIGKALKEFKPRDD